VSNLKKTSHNKEIVSFSKLKSQFITEQLSHCLTVTLTQSHRQNQPRRRKRRRPQKNLKSFNYFSVFSFRQCVRSLDCIVGKLWDNSPYFLLQSCRPFRNTDDKILRLLRLRHKKENYSDRTSKNKAFKSLNSKKG